MYNDHICNTLPVKIIKKRLEITIVNKQYLIDTNKIILEEFGKLFPSELILIGVRDEIDDIIPKVECHGNSGNEKQDLIEKASYLMAMISWSQSFLDGNKRTGVVSAIKFLRDNGYELEIKQQDEKEIRELLLDVQSSRSCLDQDIVKQFIFYNTNRIKKI